MTIGTKVRRNTLRNSFRPTHIVSYHAPLLPHDARRIVRLTSQQLAPPRTFQHSLKNQEVCFNVRVLVLKGHKVEKKNMGENMEKFCDTSRNTAQCKAKGVQRNCEQKGWSRCGYEPFSTSVPVSVRFTDL